MPIVRSLGPAYMFQWVTAVDNDSGGEIRLFAPVGCNGLFPTHKEWRELVGRVNDFYSYLSRKDIEAANEQERRRYAQDRVVGLVPGPVRRPRKGYVYLLSGGPYHKIGCAQDVDRHITQIQPKAPFVLNLVCSIPADDMYELESTLHGQFADSRTNGEWFILTPKDVEYIKGLTVD